MPLATFLLLDSLTTCTIMSRYCKPRHKFLQGKSLLRCLLGNNVQNAALGVENCWQEKGQSWDTKEGAKDGVHPI